MSVTRYCHPCKLEGKRTVAVKRVRIGETKIVNSGKGGSGVANAGTITNVCAMHSDAVTVARAVVSGEGTEARREAEKAIFDAGTAEFLASEAVNMTALRESAYGYLTASHVAQIRKAAYRRGMTTLERESLYDIMLDESAKRIGDRLFRGEAVDVDRIVTVATFSQTSERKRRQDARLDADYGYSGGTFGDAVDTIDSARAAEAGTGKAWRIGGMTVTEAEMTALVASVAGSLPSGVSAADMADLMATYAA